MTREHRPSVPHSFGTLLFTYRTAAGLSRQELGNLSGVSERAITALELGERGVKGRPHLHTIDRLATALKLAPQERTAFRIAAGHDPYPLPASGDVAGNLPTPLTSILGRVQDVARVCATVRGESGRWVTLTGPGGVGKTRLTLEVAATLKSQFPGGLWFVPLDRIDTPDQVIGTIARELRLAETPGEPLIDTVRTFLRDRVCLLVLDGFERVVAGAVSVVEVLERCRGPKVLATCQRALRVRGETVIPVEPLDALSAQELFLQHARAVDPGFQPAPDEASAISRICDHLDRIPLLIELAAPAVTVFPPRELRLRLKQHPLPLTTGPQDLPPRQRTIHALIDSSLELLTPDEQSLFRSLSVFAGGFTIEAAEAVLGQAHPTGDGPGGTVVAGIEALSNWSLLTRTRLPDGTVRFRMSEIVRDDGRWRLERGGELDSLSRRHLAWSLRLAERAVPMLFVAGGDVWLERLQREDANLYAALDWAFAREQPDDLETGLRLAGALAGAWYLSGRLSDGLDRLRQAIDLSEQHGRTIGRVRVLVGACLIEQTQGAFEAAQVHGEAGLTLARELGDLQAAGQASILLGNLAMGREQLDEAEALYTSARDPFARLADLPWMAVQRIDLGIIAYRRRDWAAAKQHTGEALDLARRAGDVWDAGIAWRLLGDVARQEGDLGQAGSRYAESVALARQLKSQRAVAECAAGIGGLAMATGDLGRAARLFGAADALCRQSGVRVPPLTRPAWSETLHAVRERLSPGQFAECWEAGQAMTMEDVIAAIDAHGPVINGTVSPRPR